jgi:hypothetical protein
LERSTRISYNSVFTENGCCHHPCAEKDGSVPEHILKMEEKIERYLFPWEIVHHKNGNIIVTNAWEEVIHKRVKTTDNVDIGDIELVGNEFIVVRQGEVKIRHYYIPKSYINNYDGSSVYVATPSGLVSAKFERETEPSSEATC